MQRKDVPENLTWDLTPIFPTREAFEEAFGALKTQVPTVTCYRGRVGESAKTLLLCLEAEEALSIKAYQVGMYCYLHFAVDGTDPENQRHLGRVSAMQAELSATVSFIESEILSLPKETVEQYLNEEAGLAPFKKKLLDLLKTKPYRLSSETEEVLASLGEVHGAPYKIYSQTKTGDMQFESVRDTNNEEHPLSLALYEDKYEESEDTVLRRNAFESYSKTLNQYKNTFASTYHTEVTKQVVLAKLRGYEDATHMLLESQEVTRTMYEALLDTIQSDLAPHMRRYAILKKKQLGLSELQFCDLKTSMDPECNPKLSIEEARDLILKALAILGPSYVAIMEEAFSNRWVDLASNIGKGDGAFCAPVYEVHPYIFLTWTGNYRSAFTLAHELGHAGHAVLSMRHQRLPNLRMSNYNVEAPSTMNELLLGDYILRENSDPRLKRWVIQQFLGTYYHNFVTHLLEGELQRRVYTLAEKGVPITADLLCREKKATLQNFWQDTVVIDDRASLLWMRQPHYYMGLYPYTYSAGLTAATACAQAFKEKGQEAIDRWMEFLKAGQILSPLELFSLVDIDMSTAEPIKKAVAYVGSLVDALEQGFAN